ncbi:hypothetical protein ABT263_25405 [Kitasatospora sp. NPDC001603]|uniref:hypothetical protein n=1 Tax=Kitasatospora sp. NPDC001603 TaxID=3154388 RepID=UPI00331A503A
MEGDVGALTADPGSEPASPDDTEPVELAPEHLRLLEQLAASRAARQAGPLAGAERPPSAPLQAGSDDLVQENERLRAYVAVLESAVTLLLDSAPVTGDMEPPTPD